MGVLKNIEYGIKAAAFKLLKSFLRRGVSSKATLDGNKIKKVIFPRPDKIGDMVSTFPVIDALKKNFPHIEISIIASPNNVALIKNDPRFDKIYMYKKRIWEDIKELREIRRAKYDCVIDLVCDDSITVLFLTQFCVKDKPRIGVEKNKFGDYYDFNFYNNSNHIIDCTLQTLTAFGIDPSLTKGFAVPYVGRKDYKLAEDYFNNSFIKNIGLNLSAGAPSRVVSIYKYIEIVKRILDINQDYNIILFTVPSERSRAKEIKQHFNDRVNFIPNNMNLIQASALISKLDILISPDTSLIHIARSFQIPVVGLYNQCNWNLVWWHPYKQMDGVVTSGNEDNIFDISVDDVISSFESIMSIQVASEGK